MEIDLGLDALQFGHSLLHPVIGEVVPDCLVQQINKVQSWVKGRITELTLVKETPRKIEFSSERGAFLDFLKSIPAGALSVYCQMKWSEAEKKIQFVEAIAGLSEHQTAVKQNDILKQVKSHLSQAVLASTVAPAETAQALSSVNPEKGIQTQFTAAVKRLLNTLGSFKELQKEAGLEDPDFAVSVRMSREIATALLTEQGKLNWGVIPDLKLLLFPTGHKFSEYEAIVYRILDQIDSSWQPFLDSVKKPKDVVSAAAIAADLNLSPQTPITDLHAKQAVLAALLSLHSQGPTRDCFAVSFAINLQNEFLKNTLQHFGEIIQSGSLDKSINGKQDRFFFKNTMASSGLQKMISVDVTGKLANGKMLWDVPHFKFAFKQMGINRPSAWATSALNSLGAGSGAIQTTPDAIIQAFAAASLQAVPKTTLEQQIALGRYGFNTTNNRILRAFETTAFSMAETRRVEYIRANVFRAVESAIQPTLTQLERSYGKGYVAQFRTAFVGTLNEKIRYVYNAAIQELTSSVKGFELYERHSSDPLQMGTRIATPQQFQQLILDTAQKVGQSSNSSILRNVAYRVADAINDTAFLKQVLIAYDPANAMDGDPVENYKQLSRTPMSSEDTSQVEEIDMGLSFSPNIQASHVKNASDLLTWILGFAAWKEKMKDGLGVPQDLLDISFNSEQIAQFLKSGQVASDWIKTRLLDPNRSLCNWMIDAGTRQKYLQALTNLLKEEAPQAMVKFQQGTLSLLNAPSSLSKFATTVVEVLTRSLPEVDPAQIALAADSILLQTLPSNITMPIVQTSVRISLTNQSEGSSFSIYFNPRTGSLSL